MTIWCPPLDGRDGPLFRRIADAIADDVVAGRLCVGARLPPQRDLAFALGVSLNTVTRAYAEAAARGFVEGAVGRGTTVRMPGPAPERDEPPASLVRPAAGPIDFSRNLPTPGCAAEVLSEALAGLSGSNTLAGVLDTQADGDFDRHTAAAASWLGRMGLAARPEGIVLTAGAQHGLLAALLATTRPGDVLLTQALTYPAVMALARHLGLRVVPVDLDKDGMLHPDALDAVCRRVAATVLYLLPTLHTPTTATLDAERRGALAEVARHHDLTILEDDVFGLLLPERPPPLAALAPERTLFVTSVSKSLAPGLRVGFVHAPEQQVRAVRTAVSLSCWMPPPLMAEIACRWIEDGTADRLNAQQREEAAARQALARSLLPAEHLRADPHGFHAWVTLPPPWHAEVFRMEAQARGVEVVAGGAFAVDPAAGPNAVRLCLSHEASRDRVRAGLEVVAALLRGGDTAGSLIV